MNTYTVGFNVTGFLDPDDTKTPGVSSDTDPSDPAFNWPDPSVYPPTPDTDPAKIDDLWHASITGRGLYLKANDSDSLVNALTSAVEAITTQIPNATSISMSSFRLNEDSKVFFSRFNPSDWSGDLLAFDIKPDGSLSENTAWTAASQLNDNDNRKIFTYVKNEDGATGVAFQWNSIGTALQNELIASTNPSPEDINRGEQRLNYLRGETITDFTFRERSTVLGDILNSSPVYVGAPSSPYPDADPFGAEGYRYHSFWETYDTTPRTPVIYVGANDGMLHGFNADTGEEVMAYVPATVFPNLEELTDPNYSHRNFVNQTPTIADAYFAHGASTLNSKTWKTVLVGGLGNGGKGLFALDVTNPSNFLEANADNIVLWEFNASDEVVDLEDNDTTNDYSDLGYTLSQPVIGMTEEGRWAVFVGNGYNSDSGIATLFIIYLDADPSDGWDLNDDYRKISTQVGGPANADKNGLSSATAIDSNGNGKVDRVYAGDLEGNMWVFDLSSSTTSDWDVAYQDNSANPLPLFQATDAEGDAQPITVKPSVIRHPDQPTIYSDTSSNTSPNLLVLFGTGQYLTETDLDNKQVQSFYGVWDKGQTLDNDNSLTRDNLITQTITTGTGISDSKVQARITSSTYVPYSDTDSEQRFGWHFDFPAINDDAPSERVVTNAVVINNIIFFTTYTPNPDVCGSGGSSWFMFVKAGSGAVPNNPVVDISNDKQVDKTNDLVEADGTESAASGLRIEGGTLASPALDLGGLQNGDTGTALLNTANGIENLATDVGNPLRGKRISWRELRQQ